MNNTRYLSKSRFKQGMECPTKLFYTNKKNIYADSSEENAFLTALAEGGFQVGELAKFLFCNDPVGEDITIKELDYDISLSKTLDKISKSGKVVIAEAAFLFNNFFIRTDIFIKEGNQIDLYEVKAKSWSNEGSFWSSKGALTSKWLPYLQDVAFQKHVVQKCFPGCTVNAHLLVADKDSLTTIEGLNQYFKIERDRNDRPVVKIKPGTTASHLGKIPLVIKNVDVECDWIYSNCSENFGGKQLDFFDLIEAMGDAYKNDYIVWSNIGKQCKTCQYKLLKPDGSKRSGFMECWHNTTGLSEVELSQPMSMELWGGGLGNRSLTKELIEKKKYFLKDLVEADYCPKEIKENVELGLSAYERRILQVEKSKKKDSLPFIDKTGLKMAMDSIEAPYHFIDFETSMVAIPFHAGRKPYEAIAFQYSYHIMEADGTVRHESEYLRIDTGFPNYDFVRSLKKDLEGKPGTIFRYHNHENTYLGFIYDQLMEEDTNTVPDKDALIDFIQDITHRKVKEKIIWKGERDMQDLYDWVIKYYYSPHAKGSNSIKQILPAVINDSTFVKNKYSQPIYGSEEMPSKNFTAHTWITEGSNYDPYKTLPRVLTGFENDLLEEICEIMTTNLEELNNGGAAMTAYAYLQFTDVPDAEKERIRKALLRYCELDTMAMVMIWEYWRDVCK